jgi:hypothetical protein
VIGYERANAQWLEPEIPSYIELPAISVTKENVASAQHPGY